MTVENDEASSTLPTFCAWCGSALVKKARFCPGCGHALASTTVPDAPPASWFDGPADPDEPTIIIDDLTQDHLPLWDAAAAPATGNDAPGGPRRLPRPNRRWLVAGAIGAAILLLASVAAAAGYRHWRDQPATDALDAAQRTFALVATALAEAQDLEQVAMAGERSADAAESLESRRDTAGEVDSDLGRSVAGVLEAEVSVAAAGAMLADLDEENLTIWGDAHDALSSSIGDLAAAREDLAAHDSDASSTVPDTDGVLENLEGVVGSAVAESAEDSLGTLLSSLTDAKTTADVRDVADSAAQDREAARAADEGLVAGSDTAEQLDSFVAVYAAVAELSALDGESLDAWGDMRQALTTSLAAVSPKSPVAGLGRDAIGSLNGLVNRAATQLSDWQAAYDAAVADKAADTTALQEYRSAMEAQMRAYSALRSDLSEWVERVEDPTAYVTYDDAYSELSQAQWERELVRDAMNGLAVPEEMQSAHSELVSVVDDAIAAMQSAYDGATDSDYCMTSCYYKDTPGWQRFSAESGRITEAYRAADESWQAAVAGAESSISARPLPRKPQV